MQDLSRCGDPPQDVSVRWFLQGTFNTQFPRAFTSRPPTAGLNVFEIGPPFYLNCSEAKNFATSDLAGVNAMEQAGLRSS